MPYETVRGCWSPTHAKLNRRRSKGAKLALDLSGHIKGNPMDDNDGGATRHKLEDSASSLDAAALQAAVQTLTPRQKKLLDTIQDPSKPVRERVHAEVTLSKEPNASQIMKDVKYSGGRKTTLNFKAKTEAEEQRLMDEFIKTEEKREKAEQKQFAENRRLRQKEIRDRKQREQKAERDAYTNAAKQKAKDAEELKNLVVSTKNQVEVNKIRNDRRLKEQHDAHEQLKADLLGHENNDVIYKLKEARIDQKEITSLE